MTNSTDDDLTTATVSKLPPCNIHGGEHSAAYDASIRFDNGRRVWAFVCEDAFKSMDGHLGTGRGQKLILDNGE